MKNTISIGVGIAALISAAALANAQTERPSPRGGANYESPALGKDRAPERQPSQQGAETKGAAAGERGGQALEEQAERNAAAARQRAEERNDQPGMKQGAEQPGTTGERGATQGQASEQERERAGQSGVSEQRNATGAAGQGKTTGAAEQGNAAQYGQHPYGQDRGARQGAQQRGNMRNGQAASPQPGAQATRQQLQGQARTQGAAISPDKQARIRDTVRNNSAARIDHADFGLNVGAVVPRSEHLAVLPPNAVAIAPQYRGYRFVIVEDDIVIVDPRTYRVAAIIPETGGPVPGPGPGGPGPRPVSPCG